MKITYLCLQLIEFNFMYYHSVFRLEKFHLKEKATNLRKNEYFIFSPTAFSNDCIFTLNRGYARIYIYAINMKQ